MADTFSAEGQKVCIIHALAVSLDPKVRVNNVSPGWIETTREDRLMRMDYFEEEEPQGRLMRTTPARCGGW